jgi:FKBP-type peptidyl-prolyl cis-trans isomerase
MPFPSYARLIALGLVAACASAQPAPAPSPESSSSSTAPVEVTVPEPEVVAVDESDAAPTSQPLKKTVDPDGLVIEEIRVGSGRPVAAGDRVILHYDGTLTDGTRFDSSRVRGQPFEAAIGKGMLIQGFERGVLGMRPGGVRRVIVPPALGYGSSTMAKIPANSVLVFEIELVGYP